MDMSQIEQSKRSKTNGASTQISGLTMFLVSVLVANTTYGIPLVIGAPLGQTVASVLALLIVVFTSAVFVLWDERLFLIYWIQLVLLQNAAAGLWFSDIFASVPIAVTEAKSIALATAALILAPRIWKLISKHKALLFGLAVYGLGLLTNISSTDPSTLANLRNFLLPIMILIISWTVGLEHSLENKVSFVKVLVGTSALWLVVGSVAESLLGTEKWREIFNVDALAGLNSLSEETSFFGVELSRTGGILIEAVNSGYVASSIIVVLIAMRFLLPSVKFGFASTAVFLSAFTALALAATKNGLMMFVIAFLFVLVIRKFRFKMNRILVLSWLVSFSLTLGYATFIKGKQYLLGVWTDPIGNSGGESTSIHMAGLISGFRSLGSAPLGNGIGTGGNFYKLYNPDVTRTFWLSTGSESAWGTLIYQGGLLCLLGFVVILGSVAQSAGQVSTLLIAVWSAAALFAESFFGPIAASVLLLCAGFLAYEAPLTSSIIPMKTKSRSFDAAVS